MKQVKKMLIEARNISVKIGTRTVLKEESVTCKPGMVTAFIGPSGAGKTTLLHCLGLLLPIDKGSIYLNGMDITNYNTFQRRQFWQKHVSFILQDYGIMDEESVAFNVTMKSSLFGKRIGGNKERLLQSLDQTGLKGRESELASYLSGGEKQRLALARAIYIDANILLVDEPTASLDKDNRQLVIQLLKKFARRDRTVVVSTHDAEMIAASDVIHELKFPT